MMSTRFVLVITVWSYQCLPDFLMEDVFPVPLRLVSHRLTSSQPLGVQNIYLYIYCIRTQYINRGERKGEGRMLK